MLKLKNIKKLGNNTGFFRFKKFDEKNYLITNDIGKYSFLDINTFGNFISGKITSGKKFEELKKKGFIKGYYKYINFSQKYLKKNNFLKYGPSLHIIVTTLRCNHSCRYCHAAVAPMSAKNLDMTKDTAKKVVDTIFYTSNPNLTIEFQGGESLVNWNIVKYIIEYAKIKALHLKKNVRFALVSNLTLMDNEKLDYLVKNNVGISTSLDGDEELHNYNRTFKPGNSFEKVTYWIKKINKTYKKKGNNRKVGALLTVTKKSLKKYKEIIDSYIDIGLSSIFLRPLNPYGFAEKDLKNLGYDSKDFIEFYKKSMKYILEKNKKGIYIREALSAIYLSKILKNIDPNYLDERSPCGAAIGQIAYNYDGRIYTCDEGRMLGRMGDDNFLIGKIGKNARETYENMMNSETTKSIVQASTLDGLIGYNDSVYKPYIGVCPIHSYKTTGSLIPIFAKDFKKKLDFDILDYLFDNLRKKENKIIFKKWIGINKN